MLCLFTYSANFKGNKNGFVWDGRWSQKLAHNYKNKYDNYIAGTQFRENAANMMLGFNKHWGYSHVILSYYHLTLGIAEVDGSDSYTYAKELPFQQIHHYKIVNDNVFYIGKGTLHSILGYQ